MIPQFLISLGLFGLFLVNPIQAQLSPGPLSNAHAHLSGMTNCLTCHTLGNQDLSENCLDCHTPIQSRILSKDGFHGQLDETKCQTCHSDHIGRDFVMIHWEPSQEGFDHTQTDYELDGKHVDVACESCHTKSLVLAEDILQYANSTKSVDVLSTTFLGLKTDCTDCHEDVHHEEFVKQTCQECHTTEGWLDIRKTFDHALKTEFPLRGAHQKITCEDCHKNQLAPVGDFRVTQFAGLKSDNCTDCHKDEHSGVFGQNCLECHTEITFKIKNASDAFNHTQTRYPLIGDHQSVACKACHTRESQYLLTESFDECSDCHVDYHAGAFSQSKRNLTCKKCHSTEGFKPPIYGVEEHLNSNFPLNGSHLALPCVLCHKSEDTQIYHWDNLVCETCHATPHGEQFSEYLDFGDGCEACHQTEDWTALVFDHKDTEFPLTDKHAEISCESCHKTENDVIRYEYLDTNCVSCHEDLHAGQFEDKECKICHSSASWQIFDFSHQELTRFPLDGQHQDLTCGQCHKYETWLETIRFKPIAHECQDCHSFGDFK